MPFCLDSLCFFLLNWNWVLFVFVATVESLLPATPLRDWDSVLGRRRSWWVGRWTGKWMQKSAGFGEWKP